MNTSRRQFISATAAGGMLAGLGDLSFLATLPLVSASEAKLEPKAVQLHPDIEPLVRLLEDTPRERLLEEVGQRIRTGKAAYREVLAALLLAGVRIVQPRPVGFKFHSVLVEELDLTPDQRYKLQQIWGDVAKNRTRVPVEELQKVDDERWQAIERPAASRSWAPNGIRTVKYFGCGIVSGGAPRCGFIARIASAGRYM